jgi:F-type H+-transporting ATPase subunit delta
MVDAEATASSLTARVSSAVPLTDQERAALGASLKARFGEALAVHFEVEPSLLGGVSVRVGDQMLDGSLRGKLDALKHTLGARR